jgi:bacillopeptidase F (M6 metalloprotease family)
MRIYYVAIAALALLASAHTGAKPSQEAQRMVDNLAGLRFDQLGHPQIKTDSIQPALASAERPHRLLIVPVQFSDKGYDRFADNPKQQDRNNRDYFQQLLFAGGVHNPAVGTLSHYYRHQSHGRYNITGDIFPVVQLDKPLHFYGRPAQNTDGSWRNDENASQLVIDSLRAAVDAQPDFPWQDYDQWDPLDFDQDGNRDEPDGYIDHFILIVAGKGQASCQGLYKLGEKLNVNAKPDAFFHLTADEQACADRLWPHRFALSQNLGKGPSRDGITNARGGIDLGNGLWVLDYNMQSEYTEASTFIHEFGHSLGLPDIYARQTSNSTASWEAMSSTTSPQPQELSSWSRMVLGWMEPCIIRPPSLGGDTSGDIHLQTMNDWSGATDKPKLGAACESAMVILPPKFRDIELGPLSPAQGQQAAYSGQGNDMLRSLSRRFDLRDVAAETPLRLQLDTWFEIEAEWDYFYVEASIDGEDWLRLLPTDKSDQQDKTSVMPSARGHEGGDSLPGFTGRSGDLNGDGKVETAPGCDPTRERTLAEDNIGSHDQDPCQQAQWVKAEFNLDAYRGKEVTLRFTYFTDMASVYSGALVDNIRLDAIDFLEDFEGSDISGWNNTGFTLSGGNHRLAVPHFYLLELRDPYARFAQVKNYDDALTQPSFLFYPDEQGDMSAVSINYRPGVLMWYYNGEYLWSQNEPAASGPGRGFLLVVDANPQEFELPLLPAKYFVRENGWSGWQLDDAARAMLQEKFISTMCFQRRPDYYSSDVSARDRARCGELTPPPMEALSWNQRKLMFGYTLVNELLPGAERRAHKSAGTLFDLRIRDGQTQYRLYDRVLRNRHSADAPFALSDFSQGIVTYRPSKGVMQAVQEKAFPAVRRFDDTPPNRYLSPRLPFGGADIPAAGFSYELAPAKAAAPSGSRVVVKYRWREATENK